MTAIKSLMVVDVMMCVCSWCTQFAGKQTVSTPKCSGRQSDSSQLVVWLVADSETRGIFQQHLQTTKKIREHLHASKWSGDKIRHDGTPVATVCVGCSTCEIHLCVRHCVRLSIVCTRAFPEHPCVGTIVVVFLVWGADRPLCPCLHTKTIGMSDWC